VSERTKCLSGRITLLVLAVQGFQLIAPLTVPLTRLVGHRPLEAVGLGFQRPVPRDLPLPPPAGSSGVFCPEYKGLRGPGSACGRRLASIAVVLSWMASGQLLTSLAECLLVDYHGIPRESVLKAHTECLPVLSLKVRAV
jgi:hypothetical protein